MPRAVTQVNRLIMENLLRSQHKETIPIQVQTVVLRNVKGYTKKDCSNDNSTSGDWVTFESSRRTSLLTQYRNIRVEWWQTVCNKCRSSTVKTRYLPGNTSSPAPSVIPANSSLERPVIGKAFGRWRASSQLLRFPSMLFLRWQGTSTPNKIKCMRGNYQLTRRPHLARHGICPDVPVFIREPDYRNECNICEYCLRRTTLSYGLKSLLKNFHVDKYIGGHWSVTYHIFFLVVQLVLPTYASGLCFYTIYACILDSFFR